VTLRPVSEPGIRARAGLLPALLVTLLLVASACGDDRSAPSGPSGRGARGGDCAGAPTVSDADGLRRALADAAPGDVIVLADGRYDGQFTASGSGTAGAAITLCGSRDAELAGGSVEHGYTLHLDGASYWRVQGFSVTGGQKGVVLDHASHNQLRGLRIGAVGDEALHLRAGSSHNLVEDNVVRGTGLREPAYGEGIYVGSARSNWCDVSGCDPDRSDDNRIVANDVSGTTAEAVDVKEGTTGGELRDNLLRGPTSPEADSVVDLKGSDWLVSGNRIRATGPDGIQVHVILEGWGSGNQIMGNSFTLTQPGYAVHLVGTAERADNVVACAQQMTPRGVGETTNVACR
jgi:hypothetical protein